jgi:hypothetical protein
MLDIFVLATDRRMGLPIIHVKSYGFMKFEVGDISSMVIYNRVNAHFVSRTPRVKIIVP